MKRFILYLLVAAGGVVLLIGLWGCKTNQYIVPSPVMVEYEDPFEFPAGLLMSRTMRDQWFSKKTGLGRVDIPIGKVVLDFAKAHLGKAFQPPAVQAETDTRPQGTEGFYTIRYYDRRSEQGLLFKVNSVDFMLEGTTAYARLNISIEDASGAVRMRKDYYGKGVPEEGYGLLQKTVYKENSIELSTAAALKMIFEELLNDVGDLVR